MNLAGLEHEYGHYISAQLFGSAYYDYVIQPASLANYITSHDTHSTFWTETMANSLSSLFFGAESDIATRQTDYPTDPAHPNEPITTGCN